MQIAVIGAGAIGSMLAVRLAPQAGKLTLVARGARLAHLLASPVRLESKGAIAEASPVLRAPEELAGPVDVAILCIKTPALPAALDMLKGRLAPGGIVLTTQNGVEAHRAAATELPGAAIVAARVHGFFAMEGELVRHVGVEPSLVYGCTQGDAALAHARIDALFTDSGIAVEPSPDIERALWRKFMLAAALGGAALALGVDAGMVCRTAEGERLLADAMQEVAAIARISGVMVDDADVAETLAFVRAFPPDATTSLQRDVEARGLSEYDALTGAVTRLGRERGFVAEVFAHIEAMIRQRGLLSDEPA